MSWLTAPLRKVAPPLTAQTAFRPTDKVWQLSLDQIESDTGEITGKRYATASEAGTSTFCFDAGNVLYSKLRPYLNKVVIPDESGIATTELIPLRPHPETLNSRFLAYYLRSPAFVNQASHHVAGAKMPRVIMDWFWEHEAPLPAPREQSRIVELLDEADRLRRLRREADAKAARILPTLFLKMFGDPATNPMGWPLRPLGQLGTLERGKSRHRPRNDPRLLNGPYPFIQTGDVANANGHITAYTSTYSEFGLEQSRLWPAGTLCITIAANIAASAILDFEACFPDSVVGFTPSDDTNVGYVRVLLGFLKPMLEAFAPQVAQKNINLEILSALEVPVPPPPLQSDFFRAHNAVSQVTNLLTRADENMDGLWEALMTRAFSGQLTAQWREAHMKALLTEMEQQARALHLPVEATP